MGFLEIISNQFNKTLLGQAKSLFELLELFQLIFVLNEDYAINIVNIHIDRQLDIIMSHRRTMVWNRKKSIFRRHN